MKLLPPPVKVPPAGRPSRAAGHVATYWLALVAAIGLAMLLAPILSPTAAPGPSEQAVKLFLVQNAPKFGVDPQFAYAIALAESGFDSNAYNRGARGLMQMRMDAWQTVSDEPFHEAWQWEKNARAALAYLAWCRDFLNQHHAFSSGLLAACYHYGPQAVEDAGFQLERLPRPRNVIYRRLFKGETIPAAEAAAG